MALQVGNGSFPLEVLKVGGGTWVAQLVKWLPSAQVMISGSSD